MLSIGDKVFYGAHGVCTIEDIQELAFSNQKKQYYILHSKHNDSLKLYYPVESEKSKLSPIISPKSAQEILAVFKNTPETWYDRPTERTKNYKDTLDTNDHVKIARMMNTILRKKIELESNEKKLPMQDAQMLSHVSAVFYEELAVSLKCTEEEIWLKIERIINEHR